MEAAENLMQFLEMLRGGGGGGHGVSRPRPAAAEILGNWAHSNHGGHLLSPAGITATAATTTPDEALPGPRRGPSEPECPPPSFRH